MKTYIAKIVVKLKTNITDMRGVNLKRAIEHYLPIDNLNCRVGTSYSLEFDAENQVDAINLAERIAKELLTNELTEKYEIRSLDEV